MLPYWDRVAPTLELLFISFLSIFPSRSRTGQFHVEFSFCHKDARSCERQHRVSSETRDKTSDLKGPLRGTRRWPKRSPSGPGSAVVACSLDQREPPLWCEGCVWGPALV